MRKPASKTIAKGIAQYCKMTKAQLMGKMDFHTYDETGGYLGFKKTPGAKILVVAHIDYVCSGRVHEQTDRKVVSSALDDRLGVYAAIELLPKWGIAADILLTDNEESANSSIKSFGAGQLANYNWIVELDRQGTDAVVYGFTGMEDFLSGHFEVGMGSYSDICEIEDVSPVMAFNMGVGYQHQHSERCFVEVSDFRRQLNTLKKFYDEYRDVPMYQTYYAEEIRGEATPFYEAPEEYAPIEDDGHCDWGDELFTWERA